MSAPEPSELMVEYYESILPEMAAHGISDTTENRIYILQGLRDSWMEEESWSFEKSCSLLTVNIEILRLTVQLYRERTGIQP